MRIIAGTHRGRRIEAPEGLATRPMTDRVRENLFNILGPDALAGAVVLDLFCGSGALGLESLSRGADFALLADSGRDAIDTATANCRSLGLAARARLVRRDVLAPGPWILAPGGRPYSLVFVDPPYKMTADPGGRKRLAAMADALLRLGCVAPGTLAMIRAERGTAMDLPWAGFDLADVRSYGKTTLHLMSRAAT